MIFLSEDIIRINELKKYFMIKKNIPLKAVDGINLELRKDEILGLVGESGSGKSTVAYTVIGMYSPTSGNIYYKGNELKKSSLRSLSEKSNIQIVYQDPGSSLNPKRTIGQSIGFNARIHKKTEEKGIESLVGNLLSMVGLPYEYINKYPSAMGGGEKQLAAIARSLASDPSVLILDEPTSALDVSIQAKVITKLSELQKELKLSCLFITHDLSLMRNVASRIAIMYLGKICEIADSADFFNNPLHPYTKILLSSIPVITNEEEKLKPKKAIPIGEIPSPVNIPTGCSFHPRCPFSMKLCTMEDPIMVELYPGHSVRCHKAIEDTIIPGNINI